MRSSTKAITAAVLLSALTTLGASGCAGRGGDGASATPELAGRLIAVGIPGAGGVSQVGTFHPGGPIYDKPTFRAFTRPGGILDPERLFVVSSSNFGAPLGRPDQPQGSVLSLDPRGAAPITIPASFAAAGGQVSALEGRVMLYTANSPAFMNRVYNPGAVTADLVPVANPTAISINNAFGRPWFTNVPSGLSGTGTQSVIDPDGRPLDGAPSKIAGGIFAGALTNRVPQLIPGAMATGALATALLGKSPDGGGRAVFAGLHADGSVIQIHVELGVDGLAPAGTITRLDSGSRAARSGMVFNWVPNRILYVADPAANAIVALTLVPDGKVFRVESTRRLVAPALDMPVDLAPAVVEVANPGFASNTTLAGEADIYVLNRGNGTVVRLKQSGAVVAVRSVALPGIGRLGPGRLSGIAGAADARRMWITISGSLPGQPEGALIEVPAFGAPQQAAARW